MRKRLAKVTALVLCLGILALSAPMFAFKAEKPKADMQTIVEKTFHSLLKLFTWMNPVIQPEIWKNEVPMWKTTGQLDIGRTSDED
jgi:hypothetical protein